MDRRSQIAYMHTKAGRCKYEKKFHFCHRKPINCFERLRLSKCFENPKGTCRAISVRWSIEDTFISFLKKKSRGCVPQRIYVTLASHKKIGHLRFLSASRIFVFLAQQVVFRQQKRNNFRETRLNAHYVWCYIFDCWRIFFCCFRGARPLHTQLHCALAFVSSMLICVNSK